MRKKPVLEQKGQSHHGRQSWTSIPTDYCSSVLSRTHYRPVFLDFPKALLEHFDFFFYAAEHPRLLSAAHEQCQTPLFDGKAVTEAVERLRNCLGFGPVVAFIAGNRSGVKP